MRLAVLLITVYRFVQSCKRVEYDGSCQFWITISELVFWWGLLGYLGLWTNH